MPRPRHRFGIVHEAPISRIPAPRPGHAVSLSTAIALAEDAARAGEAAVAEAWLAEAIRIEEDERAEKARRKEIERQATREAIAWQARRYGL